MSLAFRLVAPHVETINDISRASYVCSSWKRALRPLTSLLSTVSPYLAGQSLGELILRVTESPDTTDSEFLRLVSTVPKLRDLSLTYGIDVKVLICAREIPDDTFDVGATDSMQPLAEGSGGKERRRASLLPPLLDALPGLVCLELYDWCWEDGQFDSGFSKAGTNENPPLNLLAVVLKDTNWPPSLFQHLRRLPKLVFLHINGMTPDQAEGMVSIADLPSLSCLCACPSGNCLLPDDFFLQLGHLPDLVELTTEAFTEEAIRCIGQLSGLTKLQLQQGGSMSLPEVSYLRHISRMSNLEDLELTCCNDLSFLPQVTPLTGLRVLKVGATQRQDIRHEDVMHLCEFTRLQELHLSRLNAHGDCLVPLAASLSRLTCLGIERALTDHNALRCMGRFPALRELKLDCQVYLSVDAIRLAEDFDITSAEGYVRMVTEQVNAETEEGRAPIAVRSKARLTGIMSFG